jgi:MYXO-CTERM domain-containing protein
VGRSAQAAGAQSRWARRGPRWGLGLAVTALGLALGASAQADISISSVDHDSKLHPSYEYYISKQDCLDNSQFTFNLSVGTTSLSAIEVWMSELEGAQCWDPAYRAAPDTSKNCVSLADVLNDNPFKINAKTLLRGLSGGNPEDCSESPAKVVGRRFYIYFVDTTVAVPDTGGGGSGGGRGEGSVYAKWNEGWVDIQGPSAGTPELEVGDKSLIVKYSSPGDDIYQYSFYCAESPSGAEGDGGACLLPGLTAGEVPTVPSECATDVGMPPGPNTLKGLKNDTTYAVAMAAVDKVDNLGPLSEIKCEAPQLTKGFFDDYREAGGEAGGGCGLCSAGSDAGSGLPALAGTALALAVVAGRRRRRDVPRSARGAE